MDTVRAALLGIAVSLSIQNKEARHLSPVLMPISRHLPICRRDFFGTASFSR